MSLSVEKKTPAQGVTLFVCQGEIDAHTYDDLDEEIKDAVDSGALKILLDLSKITYISSAGMGVLISSQNEVTGAGGLFVLIAVQPPVAKVFESMGFLDLFTIAPNMEQALAAAG